VFDTEAPEVMPNPHVLFLNRSYWPDAEATGQLLTELCEDLAADFDVTVVAGQPNQNPAGVPFRRWGVETRNGVCIRRVWNSRFPKRFLPGRAVNLLSYLGNAWLATRRRMRADIVVVETDPPLLCLLGAFLQRRWGAKLVVYLQDIYPDVAIALGKLPEGRLARWLRRAMYATYRQADRVVVLSRDMERRLVDSGVAPHRISRIPNWIDTNQVFPHKESNAFREAYGLDGRFVVMYSGNLGLSQRLEDVLAAAETLRDRRDVEFVLVGDGASRRRLEASVRRANLNNVRFLPYQPREQLADSLSAADLHLVSLDPRVSSCLMPSKLYGILASGTPLVAVAPLECELSELTRRRGLGLVVPPGDPAALAKAICWGADHRDRLEEMGLAARKLAERHFDRRRVTRRFARMLNRLVAENAGVIAAPAAGPRFSPASEKMPSALSSNLR
jgi:glycosyltransferase involved in cell wall biosynthesis